MGLELITIGITVNALNHGCTQFQKTKYYKDTVVPASTYSLDTVALSEQQQRGLHVVCENNWTRRIAGVKRMDIRRMKDQMEEVGTQA